ncbi:tRNA-dihydrouridine(20a/20b) synthase [NAD(P)+]-like [Salvelinus namaycush]|uniref:tRNA-dihydrouridine(20a/20b) synthase [NAD(P)+]-like n=1 Tax=Salvelinus namaycush TaxID=8040 RepID=A0A8U0Q1C2_SALNM|nr:tRNA-dihydrouridine(20a/20b) synthase [NAD(P)+]-like [Salvelinus namaycush]
MKMTTTNMMDMFEEGKVLKICAPMVRYSKLAFRSLVRKFDCDICFTPMIVAPDFMRSVKARDSEFTTNEADRPLIVQFAASDAQTLADAACVVAPFSDGVDLNCGCPQRWAMSEGYGACLINKPELVKDMVRHVRNQVDNPNYTASIKIRIHKDLRRTVDLCQKAEAAGVSWITVHGRTAEERHQPVHFDAIKTIKDSLSVPVIANGDIKTLRDVETTHQLTGVDGVMAARGLLSNPAMFAGYNETPLECVWDWVDLATNQGTPFTCFHQHLIYMLERVSSQPERKVFNSLHSTAAVIDYLHNTYGSPDTQTVVCLLFSFQPPVSLSVCRRTVLLEMTLQWTAVALFLYVEIGVLLILCLPFISATRWQCIFQLRIWNKMARFWNKFFLAMIIILIVLFLDALREVRKYSGAGNSMDANLHPNMFDHLHMKLFRAQRNLYISGFTLFLWLVLRRVITLINQLATESGTTASLQTKAECANQTAKKYMEDNELLKQTLMYGKGDKATAEGNELLRSEGEKLRGELKGSEEALKKSQSEMEAMKKQSYGLTKEYDRLLNEHQNLQEIGDKKDD